VGFLTWLPFHDLTVFRLYAAKRGLMVPVQLSIDDLQPSVDVDHDGEVSS
jgi:hypothetical protein